MGEKETTAGEALRESPTKQSTGQTTARESPTRASLGRESSAPRDVATGQSSGRVANIGSSGQDGVGIEDASAAENLGSSGQERSGGGEAIPGKPSKEQ